MFQPRRGKVLQRKSTLFPNKYQSFSRLRVFFSSETEFFWGGPNGKVVAPGVLVICPGDKDRGSKTKKWLLAPNTRILWSKLHIFFPSGPLEPGRSIFSTQKGCLIGSLIWGNQKFYSLPPKKMDFSAQNWHSWPNMGIVLPIWSYARCPTKKQCEWGAQMVFRYVGTKTFAPCLKK